MNGISPYPHCALSPHYRSLTRVCRWLLCLALPLTTITAFPSVAASGVVVTGTPAATATATATAAPATTVAHTVLAATEPVTPVATVASHPAAATVAVPPPAPIPNTRVAAPTVPASGVAPAPATASARPTSPVEAAVPANTPIPPGIANAVGTAHPATPVAQPAPRGAAPVLAATPAPQATPHTAARTLPAGTIAPAPTAHRTVSTLTPSAAATATIAATTTPTPTAATMIQPRGSSGYTISVPATVTMSSVAIGSTTQYATNTIPIAITLPTLTTGFHITLNPTQFSANGAPTHTLPADAVSVASVTCTDGVCVSISNLLVGTTNAVANSTTPIYKTNASLALGGSLTLAAAMRVAVPPNTYVGSYSSTYTLDIFSGP